MKKLIILIIVISLLLFIFLTNRNGENTIKPVKKLQKEFVTKGEVVSLEKKVYSKKEITRKNAELSKTKTERSGSRLTKSRAVKIIKKIPYISLDQQDHFAEYFDRKIRVTFFSRKHPKNKVTLDEFEVIMDDQSGEILAAAAFFYSKDRIEKPDVASPISLEKAIEVAKREAQYEKLSKSLKLFKIRTEYIKGGLIRVIFLANTWDSKAKELARGPDFMASILIDAKTGKIVDYMVGR